MKAFVERYSKSPFYFEEEYSEGKRLCAWTGDETAQEAAFAALLEVVEDRIEFLLKLNVGMSDDGPIWERTMGGILKENLTKVIQEHKRWFFEDGGFQICIRRAEAPDYFAYDDHGIFWIYSKDSRFVDALDRLSFERRKDELIIGRGHWHCGVKDSEAKAQQFRTAIVESSLFLDE